MNTLYGYNFYRNLWMADNRNFGERFGEPIIGDLFKLHKASNHSFDRFDDGRCVEIKSTRMLIAQTDQHTYAAQVDRAAVSNQTYKGNVNHLKLAYFDFLYYPVFFKDCILIFGITKLQILSHAKTIRYHPTQGRGSVTNLDGEFSLTSKNIGYHMTNFLKGTITYKTAYKHWKAGNAKQC